MDSWIAEQKKEVTGVRKSEETHAKCYESCESLCFFNDSWFLRAETRLANAATAEVAIQQRTEKLHVAVARSTFGSQNVQNTSRSGPRFQAQMSKNARPVWREAILQVKMFKKKWSARTTLWSSDVEKWQGAVARSAKARDFGPLFEVQMPKNGTPLWRETNFQVKKKREKKMCPGHVFELLMSKQAHVQNHLLSGTLLELPMWKRCPTEGIDRLIGTQSANQSVCQSTRSISLVTHLVT